MAKEQEKNKVPLPVEGERNVLVTSALPYVNNVPHLGNIIGSVLSADVYARYCRSRGYNVLYVCGTDEYGTTTEFRAIQEGLSHREICDKYHVLHKGVYEWFDISFDYFGRTSTEEHTEVCHEVFGRLYENGCFQVDAVEMFYCEKCSKFLADSFVEGECPRCSSVCKGDQCEKCGAFLNARELKNPVCKICLKTSPSLRRCDHLFLNLPVSLQDELRSHCSDMSISNPDARGTTEKLLSELAPKCITRDLEWGVPVPLDNFRHKVLYVWFDAPLGYISITKCHTRDDRWKLWWKNPRNVELHQFMGKDNVSFHTVLFPSLLLGTREGWTLPTSIHATQFLISEDQKFSKSNGVGVFGDDAKDTGLPATVWRYYLLRVRPDEGKDSKFCWNDLQTKVNDELVDKLGNFVHRVLSIIAKPLGKGCGSIIPDAQGVELDELDKNFAKTISEDVEKCIQALEKAELRHGLETAMKVAREGNKYFQENQVWKICSENPSRFSIVVKTLVGVVCILTALLEPFVPTVTSEVLDQLKLGAAQVSLSDENIERFRRPWDIVPSGHQIGTPKLLFRKLKPDEIKELSNKYSGSKVVATKTVSQP